MHCNPLKKACTQIQTTFTMGTSKTLEHFLPPDYKDRGHGFESRFNNTP